MNVDPEITFEEALKNLEEIVKQLEEGAVSLDDSLKKFEEGVQLARVCRARLEQYQARVELLLEEDGNLKTVPFKQGESE